MGVMAITGDKAAGSAEDRRRKIEELFDRHARGVGGYVLARVGGADLAEEIAARIFSTAAARIDQCKSSPAGWLWSIARTELALHYRLAGRNTMQLSEDLPDPEPGPEELARQKEDWRRAVLAMESMRDDQRKVLFMKFFQDMRNVDIAAEMAMEPSNVGVLVHRALKELRLRLTAGGAGRPEVPPDK